MFPVSDVIPSRTTPFVTIGLIVLNALAFLYELTLERTATCSSSCELYGVVPGRLLMVVDR